MKFCRILAEAPVLCLLNETKYQSHVTARVWFVSGSGVRFVSGFAVCVRFVSGCVSGSGPVSGFVSGSCLVCILFVSGSYLGSCPGPRLARAVGFLSDSRPVCVCFVSASCLGLCLNSYLVSCLDRI